MSNKTTTSEGASRVSLSQVEKALEAGIRNTERAAAADTDLETCAAELDRGIARWSGGLVHVELSSGRRPKPTPQTMVTFLTGGMLDEFETSLAMQAYGRDDRRAVLCWVRPAARGYPIDISYADVQHRVSAPDGLLDAFMRMLTHPAVAQVLLEVRNRAAHPRAPVAPTRPTQLVGASHDPRIGGAPPSKKEPAPVNKSTATMKRAKSETAKKGSKKPRSSQGKRSTPKK